MYSVTRIHEHSRGILRIHIGTYSTIDEAISEAESWYRYMVNSGEEEDFEWVYSRFMNRYYARYLDDKHIDNGLFAFVIRHVQGE